MKAPSMGPTIPSNPAATSADTTGSTRAAGPWFDRLLPDRAMRVRPAEIDAVVDATAPLLIEPRRCRRTVDSERSSWHAAAAVLPVPDTRAPLDQSLRPRLAGPLRGRCRDACAIG